MLFKTEYASDINLEHDVENKIVYTYANIHEYMFCADVSISILAPMMILSLTLKKYSIDSYSVEIIHNSTD